MLQIDRTYISVALLLALAGMLLGLYMGVAGDNRLLTVHVALMLPGFATLAIYGMLFRLWPDLQKSGMAAAQFWTAMVGVAGLVIGSYLFIVYGSVPVAAIGSIAAIVAATILVLMFWTTSDTVR